MSFGEWLQQQLDKRGWSQRDLIKHVRMEGHQLSEAHFITHYDRASRFYQMCVSALLML